MTNRTTDPTAITVDPDVPLVRITREFDARDLIAQFQRQLESGDCLPASRAHVVGRLGQPLAARREGEGGALAGRTFGTDNACFELTLAVEAGRNAERLIACPVGDDLEATARAG